MELFQHFINHVKHQNLFEKTDHLLLAVSGGADSAVLCELCHRAGYSFSIAHANFQLRGKESDDDEEFVRHLADIYKVPVHVRLFETRQYVAQKTISVQVAARELRYNWFNELLVAGHRWLLTAHHAGDNTETMLMNFFRGTGISGLRGILPKANNTVRPLLPFSKDDIIHFARESNLQWREDSSNISDKYSRNYFRNSIIPMIKNIYPEAESNMRENAGRFREIEVLYNQSLDLHKKRLLEKKGSEIHIPLLKLKKAQPLHTIVHEIIKSYGFSAHQVDDVVHLIDGEHGKFIASSTHRIIKNRNWLIIAEKEPAPTDFIIIEKDQTDAGGGILKINISSAVVISTDPLIAHIDSREIIYPLILRKWKEGDYFYPIGMTRKKKVSRFLIDQKLSPTQKEKILVLESNKKICWVAGQRIDNRFRITAATKKIVQLVYNDQLLK
jgi:tRNA(Ile)-lysidine synthase